MLGQVLEQTGQRILLFNAASAATTTLRLAFGATFASFLPTPFVVLSHGGLHDDKRRRGIQTCAYVSDPKAQIHRVMHVV